MRAATTSFAGSDMLIYFVFPGAKPIYIGTASTLTYSTFREIRQVRTLGRTNVKGVTRGPRTIGGTIIFTVLEQHAVNDIMDVLKTVTPYKNYDKIKPDELPSFDIVISFANEYGQSASKIIYGVTLVDDNTTLSIEDIFTENTMTYIARDIDHMKNSKSGRLDYKASYSFRGDIESAGKFSISQIDDSPSYEAYVQLIKRLNSMK